MSQAATHHERPQPVIDRADTRVVLTLDAGGTNFAFSALCAGDAIGKPCTLPSCGSDLGRSLDNLIEGFERLIDSLEVPPSAISFAFPGPADYPNGVVFNVGNLPAYADGVAVGPLLEDRFGLPVFLNNDGDLFALGEATAGLLPIVNDRLAARGTTRRYRNLFAVTLGTGLGGGAVIDGKMLSGDHSAAAEIWRLPSGLDNELLAEEDASIRAVRGAYARAAGIDFDAAPQPADIYQIAIGDAPGDQEAATQAFSQLGKAVGETIATATCLLDGLVVIGGGLAGAADLFMPALVESIARSLRKRDGGSIPRLEHEVFDLRSEEGIDALAAAPTRRVTVPGSGRTIECHHTPRLGVGVSRLGTNHATALGAYAFAIQQLDNQ